MLMIEPASSPTPKPTSTFFTSLKLMIDHKTPKAQQAQIIPVAISKVNGATQEEAPSSAIYIYLNFIIAIANNPTRFLYKIMDL